MSIVQTSRRTLIRSAKLLPFLLCAVICVSYIESIYSLYTECFMTIDNCVVLDKPLSRAIAGVYVYDWYAVIVLAVLSLSMETCVFNKLAVVYTGLNIIERNYFITIELYTEYIYLISIVNIIICVWLVYNGLRRILKPSDAIS